jgi:aconitate hydratase
MGVLPLQFRPGDSARRLGLTGHEVIDIRGLADLADATAVRVRAGDREFDAIVRLDTEREREIYDNGGVMKIVLRRLQRANIQP